MPMNARMPTDPPAPLDRARSAAAVMVAVGAAALAGLSGCAPEATVLTGHGAAVADAGGSGSTSPESSRARSRRLAWEAAVEGIAISDGTLGVTISLPADAAALDADRSEADEAMRRNRRTDAVAASVRVIRRDPSHAPDWERLATAFRHTGRLELASAANRTARSLDPGRRASGYAIAVDAARVGDFDRAIDLISTHLEEHPGDTAATSRLATWAWFAGDADAAWTAILRTETLGGTVPPQLRSMVEAARAADAAN